MRSKGNDWRLSYLGVFVGGMWTVRTKSGQFDHSNLLFGGLDVFLNVSDPFESTIVTQSM